MSLRPAALLAALALALLAGCSTPVLAPADRPEQVGFSSSRLADHRQALQAAVDKGELAGAVVLVARQGRIAQFDAIGWRDPAKRAPMQRDTVFRIASMTKPITAVAAMILVERGQLALDAPVSQYLPEFRNAQVAVPQAGPDGKPALGADGKPLLTLRPAEREMTVRDLLRHTSGLTYDFTGLSPVRPLYQQAGLRDSAQDNATFVTKIARLPLTNQPGTTWHYSFSSDVAGRVIEVASGRSLGDFAAQEIFGPLGMRDTQFPPTPAALADRLAETLPDAQGKPIPLGNPATIKWQQGGGGALSTAADYARFCQMLLQGGELDGRRILSAASVQQIMANQIAGLAVQTVAPALDVRAESGHGFGLGGMVRLADNSPRWRGHAGEYAWTGALGTTFWIDPKDQLIAVFMVQIPLTAFPFQVKQWTQAREAVYGARID